MSIGCQQQGCEGCQTGQVVCRCLQVTETALVDAILTLELRSVREVRRCTGAGDGCMACHRKIQGYLDRYSASSPSMCSAK